MSDYITHLKYVKERADIVEIVGHFVHLKRNGSGYEGKSPFTDERTASFTVAPSKRFFKCFSSGKQGDVIDFVMAVKALSQRDAVQWVADYYNIAKPEPEYIYTPPKELPVSFISPDLFHRTLNTGQPNYFMDFLRKIFDVNIAFGCAQNYNIGASKHWPGSTVFWQVDINNRVRSGKIMVYNPVTGKRIKDPKPLITWVHKAARINGFNLQSCLFGEHLLPVSDKPVKIVESEKTAIVCSVIWPEFIWIASGSLTNISYKRCMPLTGRSITLCPDCGFETQWQEKMDTISPLIQATWGIEPIGDYPKGYDLCDYILDNLI